MPFETEKSDVFNLSWENLELLFWLGYNGDGGAIFNCVLKGVSHGLTVNKKNCTRFPYPGTPPKRLFRMISCFFAI